MSSGFADRLTTSLTKPASQSFADLLARSLAGLAARGRTVRFVRDETGATESVQIIDIETGEVVSEILVTARDEQGFLLECRIVHYEQEIQP